MSAVSATTTSAVRALASAPDTDVKTFATGFAAGILLDAVVVRALLLPELMALLGQWNWWLPGWARRCMFPVTRRQPPPAGSGPACDSLGETREFKNSWLTRLFAAYDLASGSVIAQHYRRHRHQEFLRFLKLIHGAVPKDLDLHLVLDSYATHKTSAIREWLLRHPRFHLHFTPTSSSWLNLVERWFAELTSRKLRRSAHRSVLELEFGIRQWISEWNKNPRPFVWTRSADEILETVAEYCRRIADHPEQ